jgi:enoyl-CoA hydratase
MIQIDQQGEVAVVRLEHGKVNALDVELLRAISETMQKVADTGAIVLTGAGSCFSAGVDLRRIVDGGPAYAEEFLPALSEAFLAVFDCPRPVIAAINGHALAGGCIIAAASDVRLMSGGTLGLTELAVGVQFPTVPLEIARHAFGARASRLALTAKPFGVDEALRLGLIDDIVPAADLLDEAVRRATDLARMPAAVYAATKEQLHRDARRRIEDRREADDRAAASVWMSDDTRQAIATFVERLSSR